MLSFLFPATPGCTRRGGPQCHSRASSPFLAPKAGVIQMISVGEAQLSPRPVNPLRASNTKEDGAHVPETWLIFLLSINIYILVHSPNVSVCLQAPKANNENSMATTWKQHTYLKVYRDTKAKVFGLSSSLQFLFHILFVHKGPGWEVNRSRQRDWVSAAPLWLSAANEQLFKSREKR